MEQTLISTNPPPPVQKQEIFTDEPSNARKGSEPDFVIAKDDQEDDIEDEESEFKMGRLIRQASLNSSHMSIPQQTTYKVFTGSSSLTRHLSLQSKTNQEKIMNMGNRNKSSKKIGRMNSGAPTIPGGWVDTGSSEDMKGQIKFWARAVAFNLHQEC